MDLQDLYIHNAILREQNLRITEEMLYRRSLEERLMSRLLDEQSQYMLPGVTSEAIELAKRYPYTRTKKD